MPVDDRQRVPAFATVALDVDSTLAGIEGIDWLASRRGSALAEEIAVLTEAAMAGRVSIDAVYAARVNAVAPNTRDIAALSDAYLQAVATGAGDCIDALQNASVRVLLISGGIRQAILPLAESLGVTEGDVHAVAIRFDADGEFAGFDSESPLTHSGGKARLFELIADQLERPILHVGDGITDAETRSAVDAFAAYAGFVCRDSVVVRADFVVESFSALQARVLGAR